MRILTIALWCVSIIALTETAFAIDPFASNQQAPVLPARFDTNFLLPTTPGPQSFEQRYPSQSAVPVSHEIHEQRWHRDSQCDLKCDDDACCDEACDDICCDDSGCEPAVCCDTSILPCRVWEFRASYLALARDFDSDGPVNFDINAPPATIVSDYDSDYEPGFEVGIRRRTDSVVAELRYLQVANINDTERGSILGGLIPFTTSYESELYSAEANLMTDSGSPLRLLGGLRYIRYDETTFSEAVLGGGTGTVMVESTNNLYGFQLGGEYDLFQFNGRSGRLNLRAWGKGGIYYSDSWADVTAALVGVDAPITAANDSSEAFVGEVGIIGGIQLTNGLSLDAGYQVMWLNDVVLAGEQISTTPIMAGSAVSINRGQVMYHGFTFGLTGTW